MEQKMAEVTDDIVMIQSTKDNIDTTNIVKGYDFNKGVNYDSIFKNYLNLGIQATHLAKGIDIVNQMLKAKDQHGDKMFIYLGISSNIISSGMRELVTFLCKNKLVDVIVTTGGAIDADIKKCMGNFYYKNNKLQKNENQQYNLYHENELKEKYDEFLNQIFDELCHQKNALITPAELNKLFGKKINNEESFLYQCSINEIPVYAPAITDGQIGHLIYKRYLNKKQNPKIEVGKDIRNLNASVLFLKQSGMIIIGGGVIKHHIFNANLMRNGADFAVLINTGLEYDASDSGAKPTEALTWGKIRLNGQYSKIFSEASLIFPILISESFYKYWKKKKDNQIYQIKQSYVSNENLWELVFQKVVLNWKWKKL